MRVFVGIIFLVAMQSPCRSEDARIAAHKDRLPWIWEVPRCSELPPVSEPGWPQADMDHFIMAALDEAGLRPANDASREVWIRRVSFAITGLPPTPAEIDAFVGERSPDPVARERAVDRLLASPHFGERWARHWMDLMRYAESRGHESDFTIANAWHYRDYLISAINADVPYDRFVVEHLAGDLVADPRLHPQTGANQSVLATGWPFLGEEVHSPVDIRGDECDRIDNKIDVASKAFLGLTIACARCHDHKFDAISQGDYYGLAGFILSSSYRQVRFETMEHNRRQAEALDRLRGESRNALLRAVAEELDAGMPEVGPALLAALEGQDADGEGNTWAAELEAAAKDPLHVLHPLAVAPGARTGADARPAAADARVLVDYGRPGEFWQPDGYAFGSHPVAPGDLLFSADRGDPLSGVAVYGSARFDPVWNVLETAGDNEKDSGEIETSIYAGRMIRTRKVTLETGKVHYLLRGKARVYAGVDSHIMLAGPLHGTLVKKFGIRGTDGLRWESHDLSAYAGHRVHFEFSPIKKGDAVEVLKIVESDGAPPPPRLANTLIAGALAAGERTGSKAVVAGAIEGAFRLATRKMRLGETREPSIAPLVDFMVRHRDLFESARAGASSSVLAEFAEAQWQIREGIKARSRTAVAWLDGNGVEESVLERGMHQSPAGKAMRRLPGAFASALPIATESTSGRLELAHQVASSSNPLASRVLVNRVWHHLFGRGIVATTDNFGWLGERPTHPELLDRLAHDFVHRHQWSVKSLIRHLVLSRTYAMASDPADPHAEAADPENRLLHRMPLRRLEAEALRDAILCVSGRLDRAILGKPVPVHLTEFVIGRGRPSQSGPLDGAGRRSIYTSVRRNFLPTLMLTFDMPIPFSTVGRRTETTVPAQSLALMNDDFIHAQAGVWAEQLLRGAPDATDTQRIASMFRDAMGRTPTAGEIAACQGTLHQLRGEAGEAEAETWKELCHALFTLNDFLYIR